MPRLVVLIAGATIATLIVLRPLMRRWHRGDWIATAEEVERQNARFGQRLVTVVSRAIGSTAHRGSDEILAHLEYEVERQIAEEHGRPPVLVRRAVLPWMVCLLAIAGLVFAFQTPALEARQLFLRFALPLADVPAVTTTRLRVLPGSKDLVQSDPLRIDVEATRLSGDDLALYLDEGSGWSRAPVVLQDAAADGVRRFSYTIPAVQRDVRYYAAGGDAVTRQYTVRVLRRPAVQQFRVHYDYPPYTGRPPVNVSNSTGMLEGPIGTSATVTVCATEPLQAALLTVGAEKILMSRTSEDTTRQATLHITRDSPYQLDIISSRDVAGGGPGNMQIKAVPDRAPVSRLGQSGQNLRLNPRDIVPVSYDALDDFGLVDLSLKSQVNDAAPMVTPLALTGSDRRRQEGVVDVDLAARPLAIGDTVSIILVARDSAGQVSSSEPLHILVSPRSVDLATHERIAELEGASQFALELVQDLEAASKALDESDAVADHTQPAYVQASARASRRLTGASEAATLMRQSLYRTTLHSRSPGLSVALAGWIDAAEVQSDTADEMFRRIGQPAATAGPTRDRLRRSLESARAMAAQMAVAARGQRAASVLADRENIAVAAKQTPPTDPKAVQRLQQSLDRAREDVAAAARGLGLDPNAGDLDAQLNAKVQASENELNGYRAIDYAAAARDWSQELQKDPTQRLGMEERLGAAAEAEAVRPDADLIRARDLHLAARAAGAIELLVAEKTAEGKPRVSPGLLNEFAAAVAALQHEAEVRRAVGSGKPTDELVVAQKAAGQARLQIAHWAPDVDDTNAAATAATVASSGRVNSRTRNGSESAVSAGAQKTRGVAEQLALQASAATAAHDYDKAAELDKALTRKLNQLSQPVSTPGVARMEEHRPDARIEQRQGEIAHAVAVAKQLDGIGDTQKQVADQTRTINPADAQNVAPKLLGQQRNVADAIASVAGANKSEEGAGHENWRGRAASTLLEVQEQLASMPQQLAELLEASRTLREATQRSDAAAQAAAQAAAAQGGSKDMQLAMQRAAVQAAQDAAEAKGKFERVAGAVSPEAGVSIVTRLMPFAPEASSARDLLDVQLVPKLRELLRAARAGDAGASARAAADTRLTIEAAQKELVRAQDSFTERDPLEAAKWFARAASDALSQKPPDLRGAVTQQARVSSALSRAWDRSIHDAAARRLASVPSLQSVYATPVDGSKSQPAPAAPGNFAAAREWGRLRPRDDDPVNAMGRQSDPAGYEEPLRLYFEALGKAQQEQK